MDRPQVPPWPPPIALARRLAIWLWRVLPLGSSLRWFIVERLRAHSVVGVVALVQDEADRLLLFHHTYRRKTPWGLPGGALGRAEAPEGGLVRELFEESGLTVAAEPCPLALRPRPGHLDLVYRARIVGGEFRPSDEVDGMAFVPLASLPPLEPEHARLIDQALRLGYLRRPRSDPDGAVSDSGQPAG